MANKDQITALLLRDHDLEWSTVKRQRDRCEAVRFLHESMNGDAGGDADAPAATQAQISDALQTHCARIDGDVSCAVEASKLVMRVVRLPAVDVEERRGMVELQVDKISPFALESLVISHEVISGSDGQQDVLVAAAPLAVVEALGRTLGAIGVKPVAVDVDLLGWWRLIRDDARSATQGRVIVLLVQEDACSLFAAENGDLISIRSLDPPDRVSPEEFGRQIADDVRHTVTALELERGPCEISEASIWHAGNVETQALQNALEGVIGVAVDLHDATTLPPVSEGLARRYLKSTDAIVDLVPLAWREAEGKRRLRKRLIIASVAAVLLWAAGVAGIFLLRHLEAQNLQAEQARFEALKRPADEVRVLRRRVNSLDHFTRENIPSLDCLTEIARALPQQVELKSYTYTRERVVLNGQASDATPVFDFKTALDGVLLFSTVELNGPTLTKEGLETFRVTITLREDPS
ncbi:MAG: pilus assembly protein PilM [Verrucomicrobia bacterium]|nr:pilus assembly protein PilM [Verrucomicrobiota bacterium]MDA1087822.1 pilus assembly protein PilM [Verrucomicrobiota bacterium]